MQPEKSVMSDVELAVSEARYQSVIDSICSLNWASLGRDDLMATAWAYYFFSIQFRENLEIVHQLFPDDPAILRLVEGECDTDNLSPWPGVAVDGERMNHDEFMRRALQLSPIDEVKRRRIQKAGEMYLSAARTTDPSVRAISISSYENGGLERVFKAILQCRHWDLPLLQAFRHFLVRHIAFDSDPDEGHGALVRHLQPDDRIFELWDSWRRLLLLSVPRLAEADCQP
jgi:hypothetical protein